MGFLDAVDRTVAPLVRGLDTRLKRHAVVSSNVANAETPGYRGRDVSFGPVLDEARLRLATTDPHHLSGTSGTAAEGGDRVVLSGGSPRRDGNDVDVDREMVKLARNQIEYQFLIRNLGQRFRWLKDAITGRPGA